MWYRVRISCGPTLLHVNQEARDELMGRYMKPFSPQRCFPSIEKTPPVETLLFNLQKDTPLFGWFRNELAPEFEVGGRLRNFLMGMSKNEDYFIEVTAKLRNIALIHDEWLIDSWDAFFGDWRGEHGTGNIAPYLTALEHIFLQHCGEAMHLMNRGIRVVRFPMPPYHFDTRRILNADECLHPTGNQLKPPGFRIVSVYELETLRRLIRYDLHDDDFGVHSELVLARKGQILSRDEALKELSVFYNHQLALVRIVAERKAKRIIKLHAKEAKKAKKAKKALRMATRQANRKDFFDFLMPSWFDESLARDMRATEIEDAGEQVNEDNTAKKTLGTVTGKPKRQDLLDFAVPSWFDVD